VIENNSRKQTKRGHSDNFSRVILAGTNFGYPEADKKKAFGNMSNTLMRCWKPVETQ